MSTTGRPKREYRSAQHGGCLMSAPGRHGPEGATFVALREYRSAQREACLMSGRLRRRWRAGLAALLWLAVASVQAQTGAACPPTTAQPTPEQVQVAAREARDRGLLWRISKAGRSSYLYGTLHLGTLAWAFPGARVQAALRSSDTVALEIDLADPEMRRRAAAAVPSASAAPPLDDATRQRIARLVAAACLPAAALGDQHPLMQALTLTLLDARWSGLDAAFGQEMVLGGLARSLRHKVVSLESPEQQLRALLPDTPALQAAMLAQMLDQLEDGRARSVMARLAAAWAAGQLAEIEDYERWCDCVAGADDRAQMARINDDRNPGLAAAIDRLHSQGANVFAAVGALHMTGAQALPRLMAQRGYTVERVPFTP